MNFGVALSKNYDKITLELLEEQLTYETEEQLKEEIEKRFAFLKSEVLGQFEDRPKKVDKATDKQIGYLKTLGYEKDTKDLTKAKATELIKTLINIGSDY